MAAGGASRNAAANSATKQRTKRRRNPLPDHHHPHDLSQLIPLAASAAAAAHSFLTQHDLHLLPSQTLAIESLISSASLSLSTLFSLLNKPRPPLPLPPAPASAPPCWFHRFLSATGATDYDARWAEAFRMSKASFTLLLRLLTPSLGCLSPIPPNYALGAALFRLVHAASYKAVARRFMLDSATACRAFYMVCKAITDKLGNLFEFRTDINRIVVGFGWISLPNCCGVLGLDQFQIEGEALGGNGALLVQALVDSEGRFLDVSAGWPSSMKPEAILHQSKLFSGIEESRELLNGPAFELSAGNSIPQYILGDYCFPLLPWLLTPYAKSDSDNVWNSSEMAFNSVHSRGMELVGMAFGQLRGRWKLLSKRWKEQCLESFPFVIVTCCLLHNFLIKCSEALPEENLEYLGDHQLPSFEGEADENGKRIRDVLAAHLNRVSQRT
ncbi:protein ANTAGONIST OF LIKE HETEROCHROMATIN PROTEIN 1 isoform X2 [Diospyros lotus]|uniref:protein ANTAGONIST OF LIKE HETEROCHROMATIN PROTEIN 1 isoform X2 n=1 Tax=Diospyros lotus TaxID=55363 RepID=UPI00225AA4BE|nr:protein ANTAGONIST OF LIKE HETEROCHROMATIN PROTEIN 1 isoform X2 [Diospyros lotus]